MATEATEPSRNTDPEKLVPEFRLKLARLEAAVKAKGHEPVLFEGWRSKERQKWLYTSGRSRKGSIVTARDGVNRKSRHQSGEAADYAFIRQGRVVFPPDSDRSWQVLGSEAKALGLFWGGDWQKLVDRPHVEMPK